MNSSRVVIPTNVVREKLNGRMVLLNIDSEVYFGMDDVSSRILEALTTAPSVHDAISSLVEDFEVDLPQLESDVKSFLDDLSRHGLVEIIGDA